MLGEQRFNNTRLRLWGEPEKLEFTVESDIPTETDYWNIALRTMAQSDTLSANFEWKNQRQIVTRGDFKTATTFVRNSKNAIVANTSILPSQAVVVDSLWHVEACEIRFEKESIHIDNFRFGNEYRYLSVNGTASKSQQDSLTVTMQRIDLDFISGLTNLGNFSFGGLITGNALIFSALKEPVFDAALNVQDFALNDKRLGDTYVFATWNQTNQQMHAIATVKDEDILVAHGEATFDVADKMLEILIDANRVDLAFLLRYYEEVLPNTGGYASGKLRIAGTPGATRFEGTFKVNEGQVTVGILGTTYTFDDTIILTPNAITFPNVTLFDAQRNRLTLNGSLTHNGQFRDFIYNLSVVTSNAQVANLKPGENDLFFGEAYANGDVRITGTQDDVNIRVIASSRAGTRIFIQTGGTSQATDAGFIRFVDRTTEEQPLYAIRPATQQDANTTIRLNLQMEITPVAEIGLIIDPMSGDMITARGSGNINIDYNSSQGDARMHGTYTIESGNYSFTLQDGLFRKNFTIENGSSIFWSGSPSNAQVNIRAIYSLTASLRDLLDPELLGSMLNEGSRIAVPVQCVLILTDNLLSPTINFDIVLPASDESMRQVVRNVINTEEMMTTQVLYLLLFNKFFRPNNQNTVGLGQSELTSFVTSTVSAQLNNLISQFTTSNAFSLGVDVRQIDGIDWEYEFIVGIRPNDRWIINGNFGYRANNQNLPDFNQYITDVDIEYLLVESGKLRLRFYNTIDRAAQLRTAKNTQGIGLAYRESFDTVGDMFRYYWRILTGNRNKNTEDEEVETNN
jgi:hypothetical protein